VLKLHETSFGMQGILLASGAVAPSCLKAPAKGGPERLGVLDTLSPSAKRDLFVGPPLSPPPSGHGVGELHLQRRLIWPIWDAYALDPSLPLVTGSLADSGKAVPCSGRFSGLRAGPLGAPRCLARREAAHGEGRWNGPRVP